MGLFDKLFGGAGKLRPIVAAHPEVGPVVAGLAKSADLAYASALFTAARGRWNLRHLVIEAVGAHVARLPADQRAAVVDAWIGRAPDEPLPYVIRALVHVDAAWRARGRGPEAAVTREGRGAFIENMRATAPDLDRAAKLDPADPTAHFVMMATAAGVHGEGARGAIERHHADVIARAPDHYPAHRRLVFLLSERWYGSHDEAVATARQLSATVADGSELPVLVINAHEYARSYLHFFERDAAGATAYAERAEVRREVDLAYGRSLGSPGHAVTDLTPYRRHEAALWFWATGDRARAKLELTKVGDLFDAEADPWHVSVERYRAIRKELGL